MNTLSYEVITDQLLAAMEKGIIPWRKTWKGNFPCNAFSKSKYKGINQLVLGLSPFMDNRWATWNQITEKGGKVKPGEEKNYVRIVFWKFNKVENKRTGKEDSVPYLKYFRVYNVEQCEGLDLPEISTPQDINTIEEAEKIVEGYQNCPEIIFSNKAYYSPIKDVIGMPNIAQFDTSEDYYATLFHEMAHSTGHSNRMARRVLISNAVSGSEDYSIEELNAEFTAYFLCNQCGIANRVLEENTTAYLQSWIRVLKEDKKIAVKCASNAQKMADYILGITNENSESYNEAITM